MSGFDGEFPNFNDGFTFVLIFILLMFGILTAAFVLSLKTNPTCEDFKDVCLNGGIIMTNNGYVYNTDSSCLAYNVCSGVKE